MKDMILKAWGYVLEILFPSVCIRCRCYLNSYEEKKALLCKPCFQGISVYKTILYSPRFTLAAVASYDNDAVREILHFFKYRGFQAALCPIELLIAEYLNGVDLGNLVSEDALVIPIPLHKKRFRERGFNQAEEISKVLASRLGLHEKTDIVKKIKDTPHLTKLKNKDDRKESVKDSFRILQKDALKNKDVILVDDVYTTGATANEVIKLLRRAGVNRIIVFVLAKTG